MFTTVVVAFAGRAAVPQGDVAVVKDGSSEEGVVDFCNTPEGYCEMGKQLGLAFASVFANCNACRSLVIQ